MIAEKRELFFSFWKFWSRRNARPDLKARATIGSILHLWVIGKS